jgi:putative flippase GtrA
MNMRELAIFLLVGTCSVLVDFVSYRGLIFFKIVSVDIAKATGFLAGTLFAYFAHRFWTFGEKPHNLGSAWRFSVLYASSLVVNVMINAYSLKLLADAAAAVQLAFLIAAGLSACFNFMGMKFLVFKPIPASKPQ